MKILLMCAAGMSTSLLVSKMVTCAKELGYEDMKIQAEPVEELEKYVDEYDVFLLGPQVKYKEKWVKGIVEAKGKPCAVISPVDYGRIDGNKVLKQAMDLK